MNSSYQESISSSESNVEIYDSDFEKDENKLKVFIKYIKIY